METVTGKIMYRLCEEKDIQGILRLWGEESDWGAITLQQFKEWFLNTPYGDCIIIVATDDSNEIIGQIAFMPSLIYVNGTEIKALRVAAPILHKSYRFTGNDFTEHPMCNMFRYGVEIAMQRGYFLAYIFPARGWLRAIKAISNSDIHWETATFNSFSISLSASSNSRNISDENINYSFADSFTNEYNQLWSEAVESLPIDCGIVRRKEWLKYRLSSHITIEARTKDTGKLIGYCTIKRKSGLLVDLLARNTSDVQKTLIGAINMLFHLQSNQELVPFKKITGMLTPLIQEAAKSLELEPLDYKFDFGCCVFGQFIDFEHIKPAKWHMMPDV